MSTTVVGIGATFRGDDAAGPAVVRRLRAEGLPRGVRTLELPDPSDLVAVLEQEDDVIVVDAVVGGPAGVIIELDPEHADPAEPVAVSSHGVGVMQAIALAKNLSHGRPIARTRLIGVGIERPQALRAGLSPEVAAAVEHAAALIRRLTR